MDFNHFTWRNTGGNSILIGDVFVEHWIKLSAQVTYVISNGQFINGQVCKASAFRAIWYWICLLSGANRDLSGFSKSFNNYAIWRARVKSPNSLQFYQNCRKTCKQSFTECWNPLPFYHWKSVPLWDALVIPNHISDLLPINLISWEMFFSLSTIPVFFPVHEWKLPVGPTSWVAKRFSYEPFHNGKVAGKGSCDVRKNAEPRKWNKMHLNIDITVSCKISIFSKSQQYYHLYTEHLITICL